VVKRSVREADNSPQPVSWLIMHESRLPLPYTHTWRAFMTLRIVENAASSDKIIKNSGTKGIRN
jgi:hypothetical protein